MFVKMITVTVLLALLIAVAARPSGGAGARKVYVVEPTDTLWSIATRHYAGDPREGIWKLQERNRLAGTTLVPGQRLVLP